MQQDPLVSIIIPAYNAETFIKDSVESAINQTYHLVEVIVIDDGSTDRTVNILNDYISSKKIRFLQHGGGMNKGVSQTRKLGLNNAKGKYIALLDADDSFELNKIAEQVKVLEAHADVVMCHSAVNHLGEDGLIFPYKDSIFSPTNLKYSYLELDNCLMSNPIINSSTLIRADVLKRINFTMPQLYQCEDWITWLLCAKEGKFYYANDNLCNYRYHPQSSTYKVNQNSLIKGYLRIELYLSIIGKFSDEKILKKIYSGLEHTLYELAKVYDPSNESSTNLHEFLNKDSSKEILEMRAQLVALQKKISNLPLYKLYSKIKGIFKK